MSNKPEATAIADKGTEALYKKNWDEAVSLAQKALEIDPECEQAEKVWGLALHFKGDSEAGIEHLDRSVKFNPKYATGWYNLACIHAQRGDKTPMLAALTEAIKWGKKEYCMDYRKSAMTDKDFDAFRADKDFMELVFPVPPELKELYLAVWENEGDKILEIGTKLLKDKKVRDKLAVLDAMNYGADIIVSDLDEHGKVNLSLYRYDSKGYYEKLQKTLQDRAAKLRAKGQTSDVWLKFHGKDDNEIGELKDMMNCMFKKDGRT
jgi:tetratricopeptide (TPR) repeat protein